MPANFRFTFYCFPFYRLTMECTCVHNVVGALYKYFDGDDDDDDDDPGAHPTPPPPLCRPTNILSDLLRCPLAYRHLVLRILLEAGPSVKRLLPRSYSRPGARNFFHAAIRRIL